MGATPAVTPHEIVTPTALVAPTPANFPLVAREMVGGVDTVGGVPSGVTEFDVADVGPVPMEFVAETVNE
jgi:hypothetical protein